MKKLFTLLLLLISYFTFGQEIPESKGYVTDYENIFTSEQNATLTKLLEDYEKETTIEIAVLTVPDFSDDFDFAQTTAEKWGIGKKDMNNGLLILYSKNKNLLRLHTGYGLEAYLPDGWLKPNGDSTKIKFLNKGDYYNGIVDLVDKCKNQISKGGYLEDNKELIEKYKKENKEEESLFVWMLDNVPWYVWIIIIGVWVVIFIIDPGLAINILLLLLTLGKGGSGGKGFGGGKFGGGGSRS